MSFETARVVFDDPFHLSVPDRHEHGEERKTVGLVGAVVVLVVAHTYVKKMAKKSSASFQRARPRKASANVTKVSARQGAELAALAKQAEATIDTGDVPEIGDWQGVQIGRFYRPRKQIVTIRLDADIVAWFKARSWKYQTALNQALREHVKKSARRPAVRSLAVKRQRRSARGSR